MKGSFSMEAGLFIASVAILAAAGGGARPAYETRGKAPISVILAAAISDAGGQWTFELRDGAVWQQIDTNTLSRLPSAGQAVAIKRASLGSYLLAVGKDVAVRVRRVR
jgi:hypothetical protein